MIKQIKVLRNMAKIIEDGYGDTEPTDEQIKEFQVIVIDSFNNIKPTFDRLQKSVNKDAIDHPTNPKDALLWLMDYQNFMLELMDFSDMYRTFLSCNGMREKNKNNSCESPSELLEAVLLLRQVL